MRKTVLITMLVISFSVILAFSRRQDITKDTITTDMYAKSDSTVSSESIFTSLADKEINRTETITASALDIITETEISSLKQTETMMPVTNLPNNVTTTQTVPSTEASTEILTTITTVIAETSNESLTVSETVPVSSQVQNVPLLLQDTAGLASGCEIVSSTMLLNYYGYNLTPQEACNYLPIGKSIYYYKDILYAADPNIAFVGDPASDKSYGCYAPVIDNTIKNIITAYQGKHTVKNISGVSSDVLFQCISNGQPVIVWATTKMQEPLQGTSWITEETNRIFTWLKPEHVFVLKGYDNNYIYVNDPIDGDIRYDKNLFLLRWEQMGRQAIIIENT